MVFKNEKLLVLLKLTFITCISGLLKLFIIQSPSFFFLSILVKTLNKVVFLFFFYICAESWVVFSRLNSAPTGPVTSSPPTVAVGLSPVTSTVPCDLQSPRNPPLPNPHPLRKQ